MESNAKKRVPLVIKEILNHQIWSYLTYLQLRANAWVELN
jgi:hypothetical protein